MKWWETGAGGSRLDTQISTLEGGQKRLQVAIKGMPALQAAKQAVGFGRRWVAVVVSARWRVVRSLLGLDPKLPLLWSTDLGNVGERDGCTKAMRCPALLCDAMRSVMQ